MQSRNAPQTDKSEMVLVPRRPTPEMIDAAWADALAEDAGGVWKAMITNWLSSNAPPSMDAAIVESQFGPMYVE